MGALKGFSSGGAHFMYGLDFSPSGVGRGTAAARPTTLIEAAIAQRLEEQSDLDWKLDFPHVAKPDGKEEFAKDVAAMANSGGGLLVYGIAEDSRAYRSAAVGVPGVAQWGDAGEQRRLRQIAYSVIRPPVHKLQFLPLTGPDGKLVVVLTVPAERRCTPSRLVRRRFHGPDPLRPADPVHDGG